MPSEAGGPVEPRMITLDAIAPDCTLERFRFETRTEAEAAADQRREAGHSIYWRAWAESLQRWVSMPED